MAATWAVLARAYREHALRRRRCQLFPAACLPDSHIRIRNLERAALPDPCSASMSSPLRGSLASLANIDPCARLRLSVSMTFAARTGLAAGFGQQRPWKQNRYIGMALSSQGERE